MKIVFNQEQGTYIPFAEINNSHIVVAVIFRNGNALKEPCILSKDQYGYDNNFSFKTLRSAFTKGNNFNFSPKDRCTPQTMISAVLNAYPDSKIEVFEQCEWRKALQWLINNG